MKFGIYYVVLGVAVYMLCILSSFSVFAVAFAKDIQMHFEDLSVFARNSPRKISTFNRIAMLRKLRDIVQFQSDVKE